MIDFLDRFVFPWFLPFVVWGCAVAAVVVVMFLLWIIGKEVLLAVLALPQWWRDWRPLEIIKGFASGTSQMIKALTRGLSVVIFVGLLVGVLMYIFGERVVAFNQLSGLAIVGAIIFAIWLYVWTIKECEKVEHKSPRLTAMFWTPLFGLALLAMLQFVVELVQQIWFSL